MQATTALAPLVSDTEDLITSTVQTPDTRPHRIRVTDLYLDGDQQGGFCVLCGAYGELTALHDLAPHAYGCMPGIDPFTSPAPA